MNRVSLVGRLTKDPVLRKTQSQHSVASFTVAVNRRVKSEAQSADFINCVAWNQSADFISQYGRKGALVSVDGRIQTGSYEDNTGKRVYTTDVVCDSVQLLESKSASENRSTMSGNPSYSNTNDYYPDNNQGFESSFSGPSLDISSDDLPF